MSKTSIQHDGEEVQIRVWVPAEMYAQIAIRSEESGVSKAAITRDLMWAGLRAEQQSAQELDHLERVAWRGTVETITLLGMLGTWLQASVEGDTPDAKRKEYQRQLGIARKRATDRLRQELGAEPNRKE